MRHLPPVCDVNIIVSSRTGVVGQFGSLACCWSDAPGVLFASAQDRAVGLSRYRLIWLALGSGTEGSLCAWGFAPGLLRPRRRPGISGPRVGVPSARSPWAPATS